MTTPHAIATGAPPALTTLLVVLPEEQAARCLALLRREGVEVMGASVVRVALDARSDPPLMLPKRTVAIPLFGDIELDECAHEVRRAGDLIHTTPVEFDLLLALVRRKGGLVTKDELTRAAWRPDVTLGPRVLATHILNLRRKLEPNPRHPRHLVTVWGRGYKLVD